MATKKSEEAAIRKMIESNPELVVDVLLESYFWLQTLNTREVYSRRSDDTDGADDTLSISFSPDGDSWIEVRSQADPDPSAHSHFTGLHRFRTGPGGGYSLRTRTALLVLARAMQLDGEKNPMPQ